MKKNIHPQVYTDTVVTCVCGNTFTTISTLKNITVEICSNCHPFYTGQQKFVDTEGRIDKFNKKMKEAQAKKESAKPGKSKKARDVKNQQAPKVSLKELLKEAKKEEEKE